MAFSRPELEALALFLTGITGTVLAIDHPQWGKPASAQFLSILDWYLEQLLDFPDSAHLASGVQELYRNLERGLTKETARRDQQSRRMDEIARRLIAEVFGDLDSDEDSGESNR